jgi:pimeloyl-ACP methyl ester carboxylesterase
LKIRRRFLRVVIVLFIIGNIVAFQHAYWFTHFNKDLLERRDPSTLSFAAKVNLMFTGMDIPRPRNINLPTHPYETIKIQSTKLLECWNIKTSGAKGTIIMFHGYAGEKSSLLERAKEFIKLGYSIFLVDFMGSGGSEGSSTSIGYKEAEQVKDCYNHVLKGGERNIILFGTSMGAAAILKALDDYSIKVTSVILECPFGSLYKTVKARFKIMRLPDFPAAAFLCFWGAFKMDTGLFRTTRRSMQRR